MVSLSIIFEDMPDGRVQIKSRSTKLLPENASMATPAELVMLEVSGMVVQQYKVDGQGVINFGIIQPEKPKLIVV